MKREIFGTQKSGETIEIVTLANADAEIKIMRSEEHTSELQSLG